MSVEVRVPSLGESVSEASIGSWYKSVGDPVESDELICELETDKVNLEISAPAKGQLGEILFPEGSTVLEGALLATISTGAAAAAGVGGKKKAAKASASAEPVARNESATESKEPAAAVESGPEAPARDVEHAPSARKLMAERKIDPGSVQGTGRDQRIMKEDVRRAIEASLAVAPADAQRSGAEAEAEPVEIERVRMTRLRRTIATRLKEAQNTAAMLTTYNEVDMTNVMEMRADYKEVFEKKHGARLGFMSFFVKACCTALMEVPDVNAEIEGTDIVYKRFVHMGIAVGTPSGLVVPVVRNADRLTFAQVEKRIAELGKMAREGRLALSDMQGGTFSISNGGVYGSLMSSPILNPPQSGILGMHKIQDRPVAVDGKIEIRPMMYLALSYDHRIVDGKGAVTFLVRVKEAIEDPRRLLMEI